MMMAEESTGFLDDFDRCLDFMAEQADGSVDHAFGEDQGFDGPRKGGLSMA